MHPLFDMESQRRVKEYRESVQVLQYWIKEKTALFQERTFPSTLIELKRILNDLNRFKTEEMPPKHRDKQHLFTVYRELEVKLPDEFYFLEDFNWSVSWLGDGGDDLVQFFFLFYFFMIFCLHF